MMKPPDSPPSWYCDFKVPSELLQNFQPLVYLIGLDIQNHPTHRSFWEILSIKNPGRDFLPKYVNVNLDHKFRDKKIKMPDSLEYYIPRGIIKSNWTQKHTQEIPSVIVVFFDMNWSDPQWNERKQELARQIKMIKSNIAPHGTPLLVLLMKPPGINEDNFTTDRASAFCAATEIPPKHLFVLAHTNVERIQACVQRLEIGMREISKAYYTARIKKVTGWKDKITVTPLLVRYNFKIGFFQEIKKDLIAAIKNYQSAFDALLTIKCTDANIQELKMVASVINYRLCRIHLSKADGKEAKSQFEKLIRLFLKIEGNKELLFEHYAWISHQYYQFGDLVKQYYKTNVANLPDPVSYFISAGKYAEKRREIFNSCVKSMGRPTWPSEMNPYNGSVQVKLSCIGQRPWWNNPFSQDYLYAVEDANTIHALKYFESLCKHSEYIISNWGIASEVCRENQRVRCRCQLMSMMGAEFLKTKQYNKCTMLMTHILREFGQEEWKNIIHDVAYTGICAAWASRDIPSYCNFLIILLKLDITEFVSKEKQNLLWSNLESVLSGKVPAAIDENQEFDQSAWEKEISEANWTSYVEIHSQPILDCKVYFLEETASVMEDTKICFILTNMSDFVIQIQKYGIRTNPVDYNCELPTSITILPQEKKELELTLKPLLRDIAKIIQIQVAYVDIGRPNRSVLLHYSLMKPSNIYLWNNELGKAKTGGAIIRIEQPKPLITIKASCIEPVLVSEWYKVKISITNTDTKVYEKISFACQLQTPDTQNSMLCIDPTDMENVATLVQVIGIPNLGGGETTVYFLYVKTMVNIESDFKIHMKVKYTDHLNRSFAAEGVEELKVFNPFEINQSIMNLHDEPLESVPVNEEFMIKFQVKNISDMKIKILNSSFDIKSPFELNADSSNKLKLLDVSSSSNPKEEIITCSCILSSSEAGSTSSPGNLILTWKREFGEIESVNSYTFPILPIPIIIDNSLYLKATFSNNGHGKLKHPMKGIYTLFNRSNTVFDLTINMDSTESFMNAGPKRLSVKLYGRETYTFNYILFPLVTGLVDTPKLTFNTPANGSTILEPIGLTIRQNSPKTLFITV